MADALSDVLRVVRLFGGVFLHADFTEPWCVTSQVKPDDCGALLPDVEHVILYHYVVAGRMVLQIGDEPAVEIGAREAVILPRNDAHQMGSDLALKPVDSHEIIQPAADGGLAEIRYGGGGARTRVVCGFLGCRSVAGNPLLSALPPVLRLDTRDGTAAEWIRVSFEFAAGEIASGRAGSDTVLAKLSELLFVEAVRRHVEFSARRADGMAGGAERSLCRPGAGADPRASQRTVDRGPHGARGRAFPLGARRPLHAADRRAADALSRPLAPPGRGATLELQSRSARPDRVRGRLRVRKPLSTVHSSGCSARRRRRGGSKWKMAWPPPEPDPIEITGLIAGIDHR